MITKINSQYKKLPPNRKIYLNKGAEHRNSDEKVKFFDEKVGGF